MDGTLFQWGVQFALSALDFLMVYVIMHAVVKKRMKLNFRDVILGITFGLILATIAPFLDGHSARVVNIIAFIVVIKFSLKRNLADTLVVYMLSFMSNAIIQILILTVISLFELQLEFSFLIVQAATIPFILLICKYVKLNKWFNAIQANIVLKQILFIATLIVLVVFFVWNFEYEVTYLLFFILIFSLIGLALFPIIMKLYYQTIGMISVHDLKNNLLSIGIAMENMDDINVLKDKFREHAKQFGMDLSQLDFSKTEDALDQMELVNQRIRLFIDQKVVQHDEASQVVSDLTYYKDFEGLDLQIVLAWLGTLLDNALEASQHAPIYIYLYSGIRRLRLKVANEYLGEQGEDIMNIFEKGYSNKGEGRGIGLHHLYESVKNKGGDIEVEEKYDEVHRCPYLELSIYFENKS